VEQSIPALVLAAILIIGGVLMAGVTSSSVDNVNQSWRDIEALSEERLGTDLTVVSTQVTGNEGRTPVREPSLMDVIINYDGTDDQRYVAWLPYTDGALQDNTWTVTGISGDYRNPGVLDAGEEMTIAIRLNPATKDGPERWLVIATETGISYSVYF
jgi:hypothetical protein